METILKMDLEIGVVDDTYDFFNSTNDPDDKLTKIVLGATVCMDDSCLNRIAYER